MFRRLAMVPLLGLAVSIDAIGCAQGPVREVAVVSVTIPVFGGFDSPRWRFSKPEEIAQLREFVKDLRELAQKPAEPRFGATQFVLRSAARRSGFPEYVRVYSGAIEIRSAEGTTKFFRDDKGFELFLRNEARARGFAQFVQ